MAVRRQRDGFRVKINKGIVSRDKGNKIDPDQPEREMGYLTNKGCYPLPPSTLPPRYFTSTNSCSPSDILGSGELNSQLSPSFARDALPPTRRRRWRPKLTDRRRQPTVDDGRRQHHAQSLQHPRDPAAELTKLPRTTACARPAPTTSPASTALA